MKTPQTSQRRVLRNLVVVLVLLMIADALISQFLIAQGLGHEGNVLLRGIVTGRAFLLVKIAGGLLAGLLLWDIFRRRPRVALSGAAFCVLFYTGIVYWNIGALLLTSVYS